MRLVGSFDSLTLAAVAVDLRTLVPGRVQRVTQPAPSEIAVELRAAGRSTAILYSIHPRWARVHLSPPQPGADLSPFGRMLRSRLDHAQLTDVLQPPFERTVTLRFEADTGVLDLVAEIMGRHSNLILVQDGRIAGALKPVPREKSVRQVLAGQAYLAPPRTAPTPLELARDAIDVILDADAPLERVLTTQVLGLSPTMAREIAVRAAADPDAPARGQRDLAPRIWDALQDLAAIMRRGAFSPVLYIDGGEPRGYAPFPLVHVTGLAAAPAPSMSDAVAQVAARFGAEADVEERRAALAGAIRTALSKAARIEEELRRSLEEVERSEAARERGELLLAYAAQIPPGSTEAILPGYDGSPRAIPLDPRLSPVENAQKIFGRYTKMRRARPTLESRRAAVDAERAYLESALTMAEQAVSVEDLAALRQELSAEGVLRRRKKGPRAGAAPGPRTFTLDGGATVYVGRTNQDNDRITFKVAAPSDLWFHARGVPGAHVILRTGGREATAGEIERAASVAAWFSRARGSGSVAVDYTERRHVRKPKGSRPGMVVYERERTVQVAPASPHSGSSITTSSTPSIS